jgi:hypothetical protein
MSKFYAFFKETINKTNSISTVYVPKPGCTKNTIKWYDDSKLIKKVK